MNAEPSSDERCSESTRPLQIVIAYSDVAAGKRAVRLLRKLASELGMAGCFQILPWAFRLLNEEEWHGEAAADAVGADILIIAANSAPSLPLNVSRWLDAVIRRKQGTNAALVALFGSDESSDAADSAELTDAIRQAALRCGLAFFPAAPTPGVEEVVHRIQERSETMTPVLENILGRHDFPGPAGAVPYPA